MACPSFAGIHHDVYDDMNPLAVRFHFTAAIMWREKEPSLFYILCMTSASDELSPGASYLLKRKTHSPQHFQTPCPLHHLTDLFVSCCLLILPSLLHANEQKVSTRMAWDGPKWRTKMRPASHVLQSNWPHTCRHGPCSSVNDDTSQLITGILLYDGIRFPCLTIIITTTQSKSNNKRE